MSGAQDAAWHETPERGSAWALGLMRRLAVTVPDWMASPLLWLIALYFTIFPGSAAGAASARYLRAILGREPRFWDRHAHLRTFARMIFDRVRLLEGRLDAFDIRMKGEDIIRHHAESGRACVLLGAHFGSFEVMRALDRTLPGLTVRYLMYEEHADKSAGIMAEINPDVADRIIPLSDGQDAMLAVREALDAGDFVAFLGDRMPVSNPRAGIEVALPGGAARVPRAPYVTAMLARAPLILFFSPMVGRRTYDIVFTEIHGGQPVPRAERDSVCQALAQRFADELAAICRRHPYNWFNFFDIWSGGDLRGPATGQRAAGARRADTGTGGRDRVSRGGSPSGPA